VIDVGTDFFYTGRTRGGNCVVVMHSILSTEGATRLRRGRLVYGGGDSSTEGETRLRRGRLILGGGGGGGRHIYLKKISFDGGTRLLKVFR
jgi:hypothetical protein